MFFYVFLRVVNILFFVGLFWIVRMLRIRKKSPQQMRTFLERRLVCAQLECGVCEVCENHVGACAFNRDKRFAHDAVEIEPPVFCGGHNHRIFA